jgi:hypothetical protein
MANNLKSFITVKGNEEVTKLIDSLVDKVRDNKDDGPITAFATTFYDEVDLNEDRAVMNDWSYDNLGSYEDETYSPVGAAILKAIDYGEDEVQLEGCIWVEEDRGLEDPTVDKDQDDEDYDVVQMEFIESVDYRQQELLDECRRLIDLDGMTFDDYEEYGI